MVNSLFTKAQGKKCTNIIKNKAQIAQQEYEFVDEFMKITTAETFDEVFKVIEENGHPKEKSEVLKIKEKYYAGKEQLDFDEINNLNNLYESNIKSE